MSTIQDTLNQALRDNGAAHLIPQAGPIVAVLEQREAGIVSTVTQYAAKKGADMDVVNDYVAKQGLATPAPVATDASDGDDDLSARVQALEDVVGRAVQFARNNGFRG